MDRTKTWELAWLITMGVAAASAATFWDWSLGIPGHAILRIVFPMTLGLALVPRRGGGVVMGASALGTTGVFASAGHGVPGLGAMTSLALFGPITDAALWRARRGWLLFGGFASAGALSNVIAFAVRAAARYAGTGRGASGQGRGIGGGRGASSLADNAVDAWWMYAPLSYLTCGLLAGLLCAAIWFAVRPRRSRSPRGSRP